MAGTRDEQIRSHSKVWSRGELSWQAIAVQLWSRVLAHDLADRASLLSFYFLLAFFPLLIFLSSMTGLILTSQTETYWRLLDYLARFMPDSAFLLFTEVLLQIKAEATGGKLSFGLILSLWTASSGVAALIEALNIAFGVHFSRSWWHRRIVATTLTMGIGVVLALSLLLLFATSSAGEFIVAKLPFMATLSAISNAVRWLVDAALLFVSLTLIYGLGPHLNRKRWEGILPGTCLAMFCWLLASSGLRLHLANFGSLSRSYGSIAGVIALLFWLWTAAIAILLGGELNAIIWKTLAATPDQSPANSAQIKSITRDPKDSYQGL